MAEKSSAQSPSVRPASGGPRNLVAMLNELAAHARASRIQQSADISVTVTPDGTILSLRGQNQPTTAAASLGGWPLAQWSGSGDRPAGPTQLYDPHLVTWATPDSPTLAEVTTAAQDTYTTLGVDPVLGDFVKIPGKSAGYAGIFLYIDYGPYTGSAGPGTVISPISGQAYDFSPSYCVN